MDLELELLCPTCGGSAFVLGDLGALSWGRCRHCGVTFIVTNHDHDPDQES